MVTGPRGRLVSSVVKGSAHGPKWRELNPDPQQLLVMVSITMVQGAACTSDKWGNAASSHGGMSFSRRVIC
ncbi:hypothetical protein E2C01_022280 [Portunus trituberculatus]|uniref:Uncharacterized protein n=1 Tax=Portunus trituberculatus TaxID=210409 RepID=A0A5B7E793_PORTR|nr:hypothetical protein [Portunus trituberculatus]